jgi:hypothetical protein
MNLETTTILAGGPGSGRNKGTSDLQPLDKKLLRGSNTNAYHFFKVGPSGFPLNTPRPVINVMRLEGRSKVSFRTDEIRKIKPSEVYATQQDVNNKKVRNYMKEESSDKPLVAIYKGRMFVVDGHHRLVADAMNGKYSKVKIMNLDKPK